MRIVFQTKNWNRVRTKKSTKWAWTSINIWEKSITIWIKYMAFYEKLSKTFSSPVMNDLQFTKSQQKEEKRAGSMGRRRSIIATGECSLKCTAHTCAQTANVLLRHHWECALSCCSGAGALFFLLLYKYTPNCCKKHKETLDRKISKHPFFLNWTIISI